MSIDGQESLSSHQAFVRALDPSSSFYDRLVIIEGDAGSGKTFALSSAASTARASGHQVIEMSGRGDDIVLTSTSLAPLMSLLPRTVRPRNDNHDSQHVILVDDWQHLDTSSRHQLHSTLAFLSRSARAVCMISTDDRLLVPGWTDVSLVSLKPLRSVDASALLLRNAIDLPAPRRRTLLRLASGNPLILDLMGHVWSSAPWEVKAAIFPIYPAVPRLVVAAADRLDRLSCSTRTCLLAAAVAQVEFDTELPSAASLEFTGALSEAINAEVILPARDRVIFESPVMRAAVLCLASDAELATARSQVIAVTSASEYLGLFIEAASALGYDDALAHKLSQGAIACLRSGHSYEAISAFMSASRLTESAESRNRFLLHAADVAAFTGRFEVVDDNLRRISPGGSEIPPTLAAAVQFSNVLRKGADRRAKRDLLSLLGSEPDGDSADRLLAVLQMACFYHGDNTWWDIASASSAGRLVDPVLRLVENCLNTGPDAVESATQLLAETKLSLQDGATWKQVSLHIAWSLLDPTDPRRANIDQLFPQLVDEEDLPSVLHSYRNAVASLQRGAWRTADGCLEAARPLANQLGAQTLVSLIDANRLIILSMRGEPDRVRAAADAATAWALDNGSPLVARVADHARSAIDLALGNFEEAFARSTASPPISGRWLQGGYGPIELLDAVEASARLRTPEHGRVLVEAARAALGSTPPPRHQMILAACEAILQEDGDGRESFEQALSIAGTDEIPFEAARVRLAFGERLRRTMNPLEARTQFRIAAAQFDSLGAIQWRLRAYRELRAAGGVSEGANDSVNEGVLSEQERQVASLAARGLSNKQIAHQLYLSPRTISGHLYRVFPKLGVTSRAGLRDALAGTDDIDVARADKAAGPRTALGR